MPLSQDIRQRILRLRQQGLTQLEISERLLVPQSSVSRILAKYRKTGSLKAGKPPGRPRSFQEDDFIAEKIKEKPDITLKELVEAVEEKYSLKVGDSIIRSAIKRLGITRKKRRFMTLPRTSK